MPAYEVRSVMTGVAGSPWYARHFFNPVDVPTAQAAVDLVAAFWTDLSGRISSGVTITCEPEVALYNSPDAIGSISPVTPFSVTTLGGTNPLPRSAQALIRWRTDTLNGNRRVLGKTYVPYVSEEFNVTGGVPDPAFVTLLTAVGQELVDAGLVVASKSLNTFAPAVTASGWNEWAVLRSRRD